MVARIFQKEYIQSAFQELSPNEQDLFVITAHEEANKIQTSVTTLLESPACTDFSLTAQELSDLLFNKSEEQKRASLGKEISTSQYEALHIKIEDLFFSVRTYNILKKEWCTTLWDICEYSKWELKKIEKLWVKVLREIIEVVQENGVTLGNKNWRQYGRLTEN